MRIAISTANEMEIEIKITFACAREHNRRRYAAIEASTGSDSPAYNVPPTPPNAPRPKKPPLSGKRQADGRHSNLAEVVPG